MQAITQYKSDDGRIFSSPELAAKSDVLKARVDAAMAPLGPSPKLGHGCCIQWDSEKCSKAKSALLVIAREQYANCAFTKATDDEIHPCGIAGRIITDNDDSLSRAWGRLMRINWDNFREYDQPYFAMHPEEAEQPIGS